MIAIIDYGMGNLHSVSKAVERLGYEAVVTADAKEIMDAEVPFYLVSALSAMRCRIYEKPGSMRLRSFCSFGQAAAWHLSGHAASV